MCNVLNLRYYFSKSPKRKFVMLVLESIITIGISVWFYVYGISYTLVLLNVSVTFKYSFSAVTLSHWESIKTDIYKLCKEHFYILKKCCWIRNGQVVSWLVSIWQNYSKQTKSGKKNKAQKLSSYQFSTAIMFIWLAFDPKLCYILRICGFLCVQLFPTVVFVRF